MKPKSRQIDEIENRLRTGKIVRVEPLRESRIKKEIQETAAKALHLTSRFTHAVDYARQVHVSYRKGTSVPYLAHLLGVASLVMGENGYVPFPVTEDMVIAALLRDAVEDEGGLLRCLQTSETAASEFSFVEADFISLLCNCLPPQSRLTTCS